MGSTGYREEGTFTIRLDLEANFGDDYEGDEDGYAWLEAWKASVRPALVRAVVHALRENGRFAVVPTSRGETPDREARFAVSFRPVRP